MTFQVSDMGLVSIIGAVFGAIGIQVCLDTGYVVDAETGRPLSGVYVVGRWDGDYFQLVKSQTRCFRVDAATTDGIGSYALLSKSLSLNPLVSDTDQTLLFYKPGYEVALVPSSIPRWRTFLKPDRRTGLSRIDHIIASSSSMKCGAESHTGDSVSYFRAVFEEAKSIAHTPPELRSADNALFNVEVLERGREKAMEKWETNEKARRQPIVRGGN